MGTCCVWNCDDEGTDLHYVEDKVGEEDVWRVCAQHGAQLVVMPYTDLDELQVVVFDQDVIDVKPKETPDGSKLEIIVGYHGLPQARLTVKVLSD